MTTKQVKAEESEFLGRDTIFAIADLKTEDVLVPEWGGTVRVRSLTGVERDQFEAESMEKHGDGYKANFTNLRARLISLAAVDGLGKRLFTAGDAQKLGKKNASALNRVFEVARRLSGLTGQDVEELAKN